MLKSKKVSVSSKKSAVSSQMAATPSRASKYNAETPMMTTKTSLDKSALGKPKNSVKKGKPMAIQKPVTPPNAEQKFVNVTNEMENTMNLWQADFSEL